MITPHLQRRYTPAAHILFSQLHQEGVLLNLKSEQYFGLDEVGTKIWQGCQNGRTLEEIADQLADEYEVSWEQLTDDLLTYVQELLAEGILQEGNNPDQHDR